VLPFAIHRGHDTLVREAIELLGGVATVRAVRAAPYGMRKQDVDWMAQHALMRAAEQGFSAATTRALAEVCSIALSENNMVKCIHMFLNYSASRTFATTLPESGTIFRALDPDRSCDTGRFVRCFCVYMPHIPRGT
jgi:hypothetical protein